ncbi:MAG: hypothetical protein KDE19_18415, partial [Caldilineaceae bacterium]|nr:hypothetical protein [Caldilineaceae bacterium]
MSEIGPIHPITYRQELTAPLFAHIHAGESCAVVGVSSMGKSRLLQFILRPDVATHYLAKLTQPDATPTPLLWIDCNRMAEFTAWGLHELILTALVETSGEHPATRTLRDHLTEWRKEAIVTQNGLLAQRYVELALQVFCKEQELKLCFILDEFDEAYASLPPQALASLRALRDRHKYQVSYLLFTRDHPKYLRDPNECEGFYELLSRTVLGLKPYTETDARRVIAQIVERRGHELTTFGPQAETELLCLSGRHPGLLVALIDALVTQPPMGITWQAWAADQPKVWEECRKIWRGLRREEREALQGLAAGNQPEVEACESLLLKGLLCSSTGTGNGQTASNELSFFSPLFHRYVRDLSGEQGEGLRVDQEAGTVWINGRQTEVLTAKEYDLIAYLHE